LALVVLVESEVRQLEPMGVLRFLALLPPWAEALEGILTPVKMLACQEVQAEGVLEVAPEQVARVLQDKAMRAALVIRGPHTQAAEAAALVLLAVILPRVQAVLAVLARQAV